MNVAILFGRKNSKSIKNKNILKIFRTFAIFMYPIHAAKGKRNRKNLRQRLKNSLKLKRKMYTNSKTKKSCNDKALLEDAIQHAVNYCQKKNNFKIKNFIILLCNSICVRSDDIKKGIKILKNNKTIDTVTTVSKFNNFSLVRTKKIEEKTKLYSTIA